MPCTSISVMFKSQFKGEFRQDILLEALRSIKGVAKVETSANGDIIVYIKSVGDDLMCGVVHLQGKTVQMSGSAQYFLTRKLPQHYNALVQVSLLRKMGFQTQVEVREDNIRIQAVK